MRDREGSQVNTTEQDWQEGKLEEEDEGEEEDISDTELI